MAAKPGRVDTGAVGPTKITLEDVAQRAGVSMATASKVVNHRPNIAASTRERVRAAIEELGYVPSTGPRACDRAPQVALVFQSIVNPYSVQVLDGIVEAAHEQGVEVTIDSLGSPVRGGGALTENWIRDHAASATIGVILVTVELTEKQRRHLHAYDVTVVHIDPMSPPDDDILSVGATNFTGGVQATQHLIDLGHRRIAFAGGSPQSVPARERLQGYLATLAMAGIEHDPALVLQQRLTVEAGIAMGEAFFAMDERPTAVFAASDQTAMGILEAARRNALRVPEDVSVVGFDDTYLSPVLSPPLTTVRQPVADMGRVALRTLLQRARGERPDSRHVQLSTDLVVRESSAPLPMTSVSV